MKNQFLLLCMIVLCQSCFGAMTLQENVPPASITAGDYCVFLNEAAKADSESLYEKEMGMDFTGACIMRVGTPGSYHYDAISGKENTSVLFLSWNDALRYCQWLNDGAASSSGFSCNLRPATYNLSSASNLSAAAADLQLKSNLVTFRLLSASSAAHQASLTGAAASGGMSEVLEEVAAAVVVGAEVGGARGPGTRQARTRDVNNEREDIPLTEAAINKFTQVAEENVRLVEKAAASCILSTDKIARSEEALCWKNAANLSKKASTVLSNATEAGRRGSSQAALLGEKIAKQYYLIAQYCEQAAQARAAEYTQEKNSSDASAYFSLDFYFQYINPFTQKAAGARTSNNREKITRFNQAGSSAQSSFSRLQEASSALEKVSKAEERGKQFLAYLWKEVAEQYQEAAKHDNKAVEASLEEDKKESTHCTAIAIAAGASADRLVRAIMMLEPASNSFLKMGSEVWSD